jgi:S-methylmethionine-dependent homocysteine/selenocysteine methylase
MAPHYRDRLPQLYDDRVFLTDGGLETTLIFHRGLDLPCFAAFHLLKDEEGRQALRDYFRPYLAIARQMGAGFVLDTATWRANPDWGTELGYSPEELDDANRRAVALAEEIRDAEGDESGPIVIEGVVGPQGDGYNPARLMSAGEAEQYHERQIRIFSETAADMVAAVTITYPEEAIGIARAARAAGMPVAISFTVETDGRLPSGHALGGAIEQVDAETGGGAAYFMVNCAHPTHFAEVLADGGRWRERVRAIRANASRMSHAELDEAEELDAGDPVELGAQYRSMRQYLPNMNVLGGCCGTDQRHIAEVSAAWLDRPAVA